MFNIQVRSRILSWRPVRPLGLHKSHWFSTTSILAKQTSSASVSSSSPPVSFFKNPDGRKTFLINAYKHFFETNELILFVHWNNLLKEDEFRYRNAIKNAGGDLRMVRNKLLRVYLRAQDQENPASWDAHKYIKRTKPKHALEPLLKGPTAMILIKESDPEIVKKILKVLKPAREQLFVIGALVGKDVLDVTQIDKFKDLPTKSQLQSQLVGLLTMAGGAGVTKTLQAASQTLFLNLKEHEKTLDPSSKEE
ncbi:unnamed protein product [Kuraishia capsulata CBS 1993]|uniref:Ribosomal protein L10 n=1 Tax=Kuraishia capsulata CBS 1993 TaxID=1382522 RepID=W6MW67_9ASCO|nr:uncharacterized protein KUCA_T00002927001 [Kuraishia capsulata CBS 1993]CDK26950.1 unnamed protein product [Kuraishia capsulata CBS 1993]